MFDSSPRLVPKSLLLSAPLIRLLESIRLSGCKSQPGKLLLNDLSFHTRMVSSSPIKLKNLSCTGEHGDTPADTRLGHPQSELTNGQV